METGTFPKIHRKKSTKIIWVRIREMRIIKRIFDPQLRESIHLFPLLTVNFIGTLGFSIVLPFMVFLINKMGWQFFYLWASKFDVSNIANSLYIDFRSFHGFNILDYIRFQNFHSIHFRLSTIKLILIYKSLL